MYRWVVCPHAPLDGLDRLIVARRRVGGGHRAVGLDFLDERLCPVAFGRDVHNTDAAAAAVVQPAEFLFIGVADIGAVLGPLLGHGDIRALHVDAVNVSAGHLVLLLLHVGENLLQRFKGQGHGRGAKEVMPRSTRHLDMASKASGVPSLASKPAQP